MVCESRGAARLPLFGFLRTLTHFSIEHPVGKCILRGSMVVALIINECLTAGSPLI
ncbi:hypothetical protein VP501E541_P0222 [Vibrio phage 501E54-1]|nr:hypothetical protein VP501E541_P0222 [Vibrio phage 501E54-1]